MIKIIVVLSGLLLSSTAFSGEVYMWTDANGVKRFSNTAPPKDAQMIGKESNYVAPPEPPKPKLTAEDRLIMKEKETQLQIEREKTMQKTAEAQAAAAKARTAAIESTSNQVIESGKRINELLGVRPR